MIIGITGGTGCGKSTLLDVVRQLGGMVLDCDAIYHELLRSDAALLTAIESRFPGTVENGELQRKKLGNIVFSDEKALLDLNKITHSAVNTEVVRRLQSAPELAAIDAIALFEGGLAELCDITVAVTAPRESRIRRLMARDCISSEYAEKRIAAQKDEAYFRKKCVYALENDGTQEEFTAKCLAFFDRFGIIKT